MARQKITEPAELAGDLPELTAQQADFVSHILAGKTGADAYRAAYNCENMSDRVVWKEASILRSNRKIAVWLAAARQAALGRLVPTVDQHCADLLELREESRASGNYGAAFQCEQARGKVAGHYVEQVADVTIDPTRTLSEIAALSPELAEVLAKQHGLTLETKH